MERIAIIGLSWRQGGPDALARFTLEPELRAERLPAIAEEIGAQEIVYLATCNRVEVVLSLRDSRDVGETRRLLFGALVGRAPAPGEAERALRAWAGEGAAEHLFLVAAGLDSARLGESEISGQVRAALDEARGLKLVGARLGALFDEALKVSRRVRGSTAIGAGRTSLAEIAIEALRARLAKPSVIALIGVSPMTRRCGAALAADGHEFIVVNRSPAPARELCAELGACASSCELEDFRRAPRSVDAIVSATSAPQALLGRQELARVAAAQPLLIDLAVPPDIEAEAARELGLERLGMEEILAEAERTRATRALELGDARELVDEALRNLRRRWRGRFIDAAVVALRDHYRRRALDELEGVLQRELREIGEAERDALRAFTVKLAGKFAHLPSSGLRELVAEHGAETLDSFLNGAEPELARALEAAIDSAQRTSFDQEESA